MRVLLIDCYIMDPGSRRFFEPLIDADVHVVRVPFEPIDVAPGDVDAVVVSGSAASAYDDEAWVQDSKAFVTRAVSEGVPVLGVCFGHQLLAAAVGGQVVQREEAEVGFLPVRIDDDPLFSVLGNEIVPFVTHGDDVLPTEHIEVRASSARCPVQAFRVPGRLAWGTQFHLEYDREEQERILHYRTELHPEQGLDPGAMMAAGRDTTGDGRRLMDRFLELVRGGID